MTDNPFSENQTGGQAPVAQMPVMSVIDAIERRSEEEQRKQVELHRSMDGAIEHYEGELSDARADFWSTTLTWGIGSFVVFGLLGFFTSGKR